jgi:oligopeptide/dipeptide ABC transporter ATP-binding protein
MCQRVMVALALACRPRLLLADEPTTGLDVTIQQQIMLLLKELRDQMHMSQIVITHDLGLAAELCDMIAVMYAGEIVELAPAEELFERPRHPYTLALLKSRPLFGERRQVPAIRGAVPDFSAPPPGCRFHPRCEYAFDRCSAIRPQRVAISRHQSAACLLLDGQDAL